MNKKYVVVGSSAAGIGCVNKLRTLDKSACITLITASDGIPYNTCLLADVLSGDRTVEQIYTKQLSYFKENEIHFVPGVRLVRIDSLRKVVELSDGQICSYDALFLGLGTQTCKLSIPGAHLSGVFSFHTLKDTQAVQAYIRNNGVKRATIIGAGLSGVECADSLTQLGIKVTIIERSNRVLPRQVDEQGSSVIVDAMRRAGVTFLPQAQVASLKGEQATVSHVHLSTGQVIEVDMVVATIGSRANAPIVQDCGINLVDGRVKVDDFMQTSVPGIYAGGDMCLVRDVMTGHFVPNTTWPDAMMQGMFAACNMVGQQRKYPGVQTVASSNFFGLTFVSCGPVMAGFPLEKEVIKNEKDAYHSYVYEDARLCGFLMVGDVSNVGQLRKNVLQRATRDLVQRA